MLRALGVIDEMAALCVYLRKQQQRRLSHNQLPCDQRRYYADANVT